MLQFLRFTKTQSDEQQASIIQGKDATLFFIKRTLFLVLFPYSTLFLAVAIPFVSTPFYPIYFLGSIVTTIYYARFFNYVVMYFKYRGGGIKVLPGGVEITSNTATITIPERDITYIEHNPLGNIIIREKNSKTAFPLVLLKKEDQERIMSMFEDMAPNRTMIYQKIWEILDAIVVALVLAVHIIQYIIQAYYIPSSSMEDTLRINDHLFVEKITYGPIIPKMLGMKDQIHIKLPWIRDVKKGDIVIFRPKHEKDKDYIKRCIAVPGDRIQFVDGKVQVNGKILDEPYVKGKTDYFNTPGDKDYIEGIVPPGNVVVLGDNRKHSFDSRSFGYLEIKRIKGKAFILYWNTGDFKNLDFSRAGLIH